MSACHYPSRDNGDGRGCQMDDCPRHGGEPLEIERCPVCGSAGPCSFDAEGRPLIHTDNAYLRTER